ncbi:MAG: response regulator, partial [Lachnospiraceae bacterium]|nr:response regulator [Lachnospiraceae bacterium]
LFFAEMVEKEKERFFASKEEPVRVWRGHGNELLDLLGGQPGFNLYFLDVEMPGMNGLELSEKVLAFQPGARIVLLTAYERFALPGIRLGVYYYILKDDYRAELRLILERVCREREADREEYYYIATGVSGRKISVDSRTNQNWSIELLSSEFLILIDCALSSHGNVLDVFVIMKKPSGG